MDLESSKNSGQETEKYACFSCRSKKLKCDRIKPTCGRCIDEARDCAYPESRRKTAYRQVNTNRETVKALEIRLAQVEGYFTNLKTSGRQESAGADHALLPQSNNPVKDRTGYSSDQLLRLGMSEAPPPLSMMETLHGAFFKNVHPSMPILHPGRYLQAFYGGPLMKPPMCLQYAIWALAADGHSEYHRHHEVFYHRARLYVQADEVEGHGDKCITISHAQAWGLIATYEARRLMFTKTVLSITRYVRLCQMMGLDRIDGESFGLPPTLNSPLTWSELEERRRVFWGAFCLDAHATMTAGWPSSIEIDDIATRLPAPEDAFLSNNECKSPFPHQVFQGAPYADFAGRVIVYQIFKVTLKHVHRPKPNDHPDDYTRGKFWVRHREIDDTLSSVFMFFPENLRLPQNLQDHKALRINLNLQASIICLHHAAIEKIDKYNLSESLREASITRLKVAVDEIVRIVKLTSQAVLAFKDPVCALSLYCATTVFVYLGKQSLSSGAVPDLSSLEVILDAMEVVSRTYNITRAFMKQAYLDVEQNNLDSYLRMPDLNRHHAATGHDNAKNVEGRPVMARSQHQDTIQPLLPQSRTAYVRAETSAKNVIGKDCFHPVLGAITRNIAPSNCFTGDLSELDVTESLPDYTAATSSFSVDDFGYKTDPTWSSQPLPNGSGSQFTDDNVVDMGYFEAFLGNTENNN